MGQQKCVVNFLNLTTEVLKEEKEIHLSYIAKLYHEQEFKSNMNKDSVFISSSLLNLL